jgi:dephospho-CoA kinase
VAATTPPKTPSKTPPKTRRLPEPPLLGLTGGLGAGKSAALAAFGRLGAAVLSTDAVVHELYDDPEVRALVVGRWGPEVAPGGRVDRRAVAGRAFAGEGERAWLEGVLWPRVGARLAAWRAAQVARRPAPTALVAEVPLLFEAGMEGGFDATVAVVAAEDVRRDRAGARGHAALDERAARQLGQDEKAARADHVIANDGSLEDLDAAVAAVLAAVNTSQRAGSSSRPSPARGRLGA